MIAHNQVVKFQIAKKKLKFHCIINLLYLAVILCVWRWQNEGLVDPINQQVFFSSSMLRELSSSTIKSKRHLAEIYSTKELEAAFSPVMVCSVLPQHTLIFLSFSSKCKSFDFPQLVAIRHPLIPDPYLEQVK